MAEWPRTPYRLKGPLRVQAQSVSCGQCRFGLEPGEPGFLVEDDDHDEPEVYLHLACVMEYLEEYQ